SLTISLRVGISGQSGRFSTARGSKLPPSPWECNQGRLCAIDGVLVRHVMAYFLLAVKLYLYSDCLLRNGYESATRNAAQVIELQLARGDRLVVTRQGGPGIAGRRRRGY